MPEVREVAFELERFAFTAPDRLEVVGRWTGLAGRRLGRPVLTFEAGGRRRRLTALPGGHLAPSEGAEWRVAFVYDGDPEALVSAELEVGRRLVVELPAPRRRRAGARDRTGEDERRRREAAERTLAEREAEIVGLRDEAESALAEQDAQIEALRVQVAEAQAEHERLAAELDELRAQLAARDEQLATARGEAEAARKDAAAARAEVDQARADAEARLAAERAASTEVREKLATAREEAQTTITTEAQETERLRAELQAAREETERTVKAERAETARLREELATRSANGDDGEAGAAARRMYERIARELENERAAARSLRRELDAVQAQTAEHRRVAAAAAAIGISTTDETPAAATPAGRIAAARRTEVGRAVAHHRAEAARVAAAQRVPESHASPVVVWAVRLIAVAFVAGLLIALLILVRLVA
jgi:uncharacterized coiled-coil protein SlyX